MSVFKSVEDNFADFKRFAPPSLQLGTSIGALAAWMDVSAAYCGLRCSERTSGDLDRLARQVRLALRSVVTDQEVLQGAIYLTAYPFHAANGVIWSVGHVNTALMYKTHTQSQMQGITKAQDADLLRNTQDILAWKAEIALRHGGNYKLYLERMMEPLSGFGELAEQRLQFMRAGEEIRMLARARVVFTQRPGR